MTEGEALHNLRQCLTEQFTNAKIVQLEVDLPLQKHPWIKEAGMFKDNPLFDQVIEYMAAYRRELDSKEYDVSQNK